MVNGAHCQGVTRGARCDRECETLSLVDGDIVYYPQFITADVAQELFAQLLATLHWEQPRVTLFGRDVPSPRLAAWYGDAPYRYSGVTHQPRAWPEFLLPIRRAIEQTVMHKFNGMLANLYRSGQDSMGWHSDDEAELGVNPVVASLSLGAQRRFVLRHRRHRGLAPIAINLGNGSLLVMRGATQHHWRHSVPKTKRAVSARINLTFRDLRVVNEPP
ncbi:MAG: alpha-ketoglutarate-dependent dioxygenase AlkB [Gammaproteobacteria bacterium]|nr:alpha-ketoglutarate-dependent dioxygenase AlkB [Gammaproteobacteria bacterium]